MLKLDSASYICHDNKLNLTKDWIYDLNQNLKGVENIIKME